MANKRITQLPTAPQVEDNDYLAIDNTSTPTAENDGGTRKILVKDITAKSADAVDYDNTTSGLEADNVQDAIDEVSNKSAEDVPYDNSDSGLESEDVQSAIDEIADVLGALKVEGTVENQSIATFTDGSPLPMPKLEVAVEPQQDLHGYDSPWFGGAGKNKFPLTVDRIKSDNTSGSWSGNTYSINGAEYKINTDNAGNVTSISARNLASNPNGDLRLVFTLSSGSYILSSGFTEANGANDSYLQKNGATIARGNNSSPGPNFTLDSSSEVVYHLRLSKSGDSSYVAYPMIRLASVTDATFAPYSNICPISGWSAVDVNVSGKNLLDISNAVNATNVVDSVEADGTIHFKDVTATWSNTHVGKIYVVKGQTYSMSASNIQYGRFGLSTSPTTYPTYSTFPNIIIQSGVSPSWIIGRAPTTRYFVANFTGYIYLFYCSDANYDNYHAPFATQIQIEIGETASTYEPYNGSTITIQLGDTYYGGKLDVVSGVLTVEKAEVIYDGSSDENWAKVGSTSASAFAMCIDSPFVYMITDVNQVKCNFLKTILSNATWGNEDSWVSYTVVGGIAKLCTGIQSITDVEDWKSYLSSNNLQVVYELATPTTIQLTPTQVSSLMGVNNIWADCGKINKAVYIRDLNIVINNLLNA